MVKYGKELQVAPPLDWIEAEFIAVYTSLWLPNSGLQWICHTAKFVLNIS